MGQAFAGLGFFGRAHYSSNGFGSWLETTVHTEESEQKNHFTIPPESPFLGSRLFLIARALFHRVSAVPSDL